MANEDGLLRVNDNMWIPVGADSLMVTSLTMTHTEKAGNRGGEAAVASLRQEFTWKGLTTDTKDSVSKCLFCIPSRNSSKVPRLLANTLHASKPN